MPTLIIEDGSQVALANSYATVAQARAYALARGLSLPVADAEVEALLVRACDYLETLKWKGTQVDPVTPQALAWPRAGIFVGPSMLSGSPSCPTELPSDTIPNKILDAQCRLAYDGTIYTDLLPTGSGRQVVREKVDVLEVQYSDTKATSVLPKFNAALSMLSVYLENGGSLNFSSVRV